MTGDDVRAPERALEAAVVALREDLVASGRWTPTTQDLLEEAAAERRWWLGQWAEGAPHVLCLLAQDLQEGVRAEVDPAWPLCPDHGDHPLFVEPDLGPDPFWVCERTGLPVSSVGNLPPSV